MEDKIDGVDAARHKMMGDEDSRTRTKLWFENNPNINAIKSGGRCYGLGSMLERPRSIEAPPAHSKVFDDTLTEYQLAQRDFSQVSVCLSLTILALTVHCRLSLITR